MQQRHQNQPPETKQHKEHQTETKAKLMETCTKTPAAKQNQQKQHT